MCASFLGHHNSAQINKVQGPGGMGYTLQLLNIRTPQGISHSLRGLLNIV